MSNKFESNDDFKSNAQHQAESKVQQAVAEASTALGAEREHTQRLESRNQVEYIGSCLITRPLRAAFDVLLRVRTIFSGILSTVKHGIGGLLSFFLGRLINFALCRPTLKAWALALLCRCPTLEAWLCKFAIERGMIVGGTRVQLPYEPSTKFSMLTPGALKIYADLKAAIERHNEEGK